VFLMWSGCVPNVFLMCIQESPHVWLGLMGLDNTLGVPTVFLIYVYTQDPAQVWLELMGLDSFFCCGGRQERKVFLRVPNVFLMCSRYIGLHVNVEALPKALFQVFLMCS